MKRRMFAVAIVLIVVLAMFAFAACGDGASDYVEVVNNGGFETLDGSNVQGWIKSTGTGESISFKSSPSAGTDEFDAELGARYGVIEMSSSSTTRVYISQTVNLVKNKIYRLSAYVDVQSITASGGYGFVVGILEDNNKGGINVAEVTEGFETVDYYFTSGISGEATLFVGMGQDGSTPYGTVRFDNISLQSVDTVPEGVTLGVVQDDADYSHSDGGSIATVTLLAIFSVALVFGLYLVLRKVMPTDDTDAVAVQAQKDGKIVAMTDKTFVALIFAVVFAFVVRFVIGMFCYGMGSQIDALSSIASRIGSSGGLMNAFTDSANSNQPLGTMYVLWLLGMLGGAMGVESGSMGMALLVRIPMIIADMFTLLAVTSFAFRKLTDRRAAVGMSWLYAAMPVFFTLSAFYGSYEAVAIAFVVYALIALYEKNHIASGVFFTFSLLFSYYMLILVPIYATVQVMNAIREKDERVKIILTMVGSFVLYYIVSLPMCLSQLKTGKVFYVFEMIDAYFKSSSFLSTDAFNLYAIFGAANSTVRNTAMTVLNGMFVAAMAGVVGFAYWKQKSLADLFLYSSLALTLYAVIGAQSTVVVLPIAAALLLIYLIMLPDKRLYAVFGALSTLSFLNIAELMSRSGFITGNDSAGYLAFWSKSPFIIVFSLIAVFVAAYYVYVAIDIARYDRYTLISRRDDSFVDEIKAVFKKPRAVKNDETN